MFRWECECGAWGAAGTKKSRDKMVTDHCSGHREQGFAYDIDIKVWTRGRTPRRKHRCEEVG